MAPTQRATAKKAATKKPKAKSAAGAAPACQFRTDGAVAAMAFSPDGARVAVCGRRYFGGIICETDGGKVLRTFKVARPMRSISFRPDGRAMQVAMNDQVALFAHDDAAKKWSMDADVPGGPIAVAWRLRKMEVAVDGSALGIGEENATCTAWRIAG